MHSKWYSLSNCGEETGVNPPEKHHNGSSLLRISPATPSPYSAYLTPLT